jgi:rSAM/selenodomain-associated transferase 2
MISVVVLALNEEARLPACLRALANQSAHELIVADGGSGDATAAIASAAGARVVVSERGRAAQANRGAAAAAGDVFLFLHADTRLGPGALEAVAQALAADPRVVGGSFTLRFDDHRPALRLFGAIGDLAHRLSSSLYGDRGIFVRRDAFEALGGFGPLPFMEDYDFGRRLRRRGRIRILRRPVTTSAREFERQGPWRLGAKIVACLLGFRLGVSPLRLRRFYYGHDGNERYECAGCDHAAPRATGHPRKESA